MLITMNKLANMKKFFYFFTFEVEDSKDAKRSTEKTT